MNQVSLIPANRIRQGKYTEFVAQTSDPLLTLFLSELQWDWQPWPPPLRSKLTKTTQNAQPGLKAPRQKNASP